MSKKNIKKIFVGALLILAALAIALMAFYYIEVKPSLQKEVQPAQQITPKISAAPPVEMTVQLPEDVPVAEPQRAQTPVNMEQAPSASPVKEAKEGYLWFDRKSSKLIVTIGTSQGILSGQRLNVLDNNGQKLGEVMVEAVLDSISTVKPIDMTPDSFQSDYYRVVRQ